MKFQVFFNSILFILCLTYVSNAQTLSITATPVTSTVCNVQANFVENSSCDYNVTFSCPTCTPTTMTCSGVTNASSCVVSFTMGPGTNTFTATATLVSGSGPQCPSTLISNTLSVLPIEMKSFDISNTGDAVMLHWVTASEENNDYFEIERSGDGLDYFPIARISGAGNSRDEIEYSYHDDHATKGINYYRIKQVDFDGKFSYSESRSASLKQGKSFDILPTVAHDIIGIYTDLDNYDVHIYNQSGQLMHQWNSLSGHHNLNIDNLFSGIYFVEVSSEQNKEITKVVKL